MISVEYEELLKIIKNNTFPMFVHVLMSDNPNDKVFYINNGEYKSFTEVHKVDFLKPNNDFIGRRITKEEFVSRANKLLEEQIFYKFLTDYSEKDFEMLLIEATEDKHTYFSYIIDDL